MSGGSSKGSTPDEPRSHDEPRGQPAPISHQQSRQAAVSASGSPLVEENMSDLLRALGDLAREEDREIEALPAQRVPALSAAARARVLARILDGQAVARSAGVGRDPSVTREVRSDELGMRRTTRSKRWGAFVFGTSGLAVAAAAVLVVSMRTRSEPTTPLPTYAASASGGVALVRGGSGSGDGIAAGIDDTTTALQRIRRDSELRIVCRPDRAISEPISVRAFVVQGASADEVHPAIQIAPTGAAELRLAGGDLVAQRHGHATLRVAIGRAPAVEAIAPRDAISGSAGIGPENAIAARWLTVPLDIEAP
jgi:hypothetical protein